ncbi:MAG: SAM-dependent methyltransferase [Ardenticatenaceae bacterium]
MTTRQTSDLPHSEITDYVERVRSYYDRTNSAYLKCVGTTFQAGLLNPAQSKDALASASNLYLATQAGIQPGDHILDAGCGVCGPSIDMALHFEGLTIDAITISPAQAKTAKKRVEEAGLSKRIKVHLADYHKLSFEDNQFDVVMFLESAGYSYNQRQLFSGVSRVLRPGGKLYIKDVFKNEGPLSPRQQEALDIKNEAYVYRTETISQTEQTLREIGFQEIQSRDLNALIDPDHVPNCFLRTYNGRRLLTEFALFHYRLLTLKEPVPAGYGEVKAIKPL